MSKYLSAPARSLSIPGVLKPPSECARCGWQFKRDNDAWHAFDEKRPDRRRKEPRSEIHVRAANGDMMIRCALCYETELWHAGEHNNQHHDGAALYREALGL
jgi:hypothetical protein